MHERFNSGQIASFGILDLGPTFVGNDGSVFHKTRITFVYHQRVCSDSVPSDRNDNRDV